jgi:hypothetical protein
METNSNLWFKAKKYGWGWTPCSWQGWTALGVYIIAILYEFFAIDMNSHSVSDTLINFIPTVIIFTIILIAICYIKGDKPEWHWGDTKKN